MSAPESPDYSHLIGKIVRVQMGPGPAHVRGRLLRWYLTPGGDGTHHSAVIKRRSGTEVFIGGRFPLELAP